MQEKRVFELLCSHLGAGPMSDAAHDILAQLVSCADEQSVKKGGTLWRCVNVDPEHWAALRDGETVCLEPRRHESWSRDRTAIVDVLRNRAEKADRDKCVTLLMRKDFDDETCLGVRLRT